MVYFLHGQEANTILFNPVTEPPTVAKYLPPMWPWVAPISGVYWTKTQKVPKEKRQAHLCENPRGWGGRGSGDVGGLGDKGGWVGRQ